ncbi:MAG: UDP-N-acetylglucosamine 1-carboxyvinyltransferase [Clostridia bacterium]|nr:UDP-N-acetylglucosamine 1-carboxyvinyltransferase [Clostridia bacterium]
MEKIIIKGGISLFGEVGIGGSKNAALPVLFSTLIAKGVSKIHNVPDILDVRVTLEILESFGAIIQRAGDTLTIDTRTLHYTEPSRHHLVKIRASTYLIGASLSRFGRVRLSDFGGCAFAERPIDLHLFAAERFGARLEGDTLYRDKLRGVDIEFSKCSVGATANALILASAARGESRIFGYAREPHILCLIDFLRSMGAKITLSDTHLTVVGGELSGGECSIIGDMIEAGTYLAAGLVTDGEVSVRGVSVSDMSAFCDTLRNIGATVTQLEDIISARRGDFCRYAKITAEPYPAFPTDLQPIMAPLLAVLSGGEIYDRVFPTRFGYLESLSAFGLASRAYNGGVMIEKSNIIPAEATATDLRGGAACIITALAARGESTVLSPEIVLRGYESPIEKLNALGANALIVKA